MGTQPSLDYGQVLTPQQWASLFGDKQDDLGYTPVNRAGDTLTGQLIGKDGDSTSASFRAPPGIAPTVPVDGDLWSTDNGFFAQVNSVTVQFVPLVNGGVALSNGLNSDVDRAGANRLRITGPSGAYSIGGLSAGFDGERVTIYNTVAQALTLVNEDASSTAANRITTLTGSDIVLATRTSFATLSYDATDARWIVESYN